MSRRPLILRTLLPASSLIPLMASAAHAAEMTGPLDKNEWTSSPVPDHVDMYIALPDNMPEKPPIVVNIHSCKNSAGGQWSYDGFAPLKAAMESVGFIMILPQQSRNCWAVGASESLTHDGGGDTGAIVQMVKYALQKYNGDPTRVYVMGGSSGGMTTQALLAVYPELFKAGAERAGVPAGCWAESYRDSDQWSDPCGKGTVDKTAQEWGDYVRAINPDFAGPYPRMFLNHGNADTTINVNNLRESVEQWTNLLGLDETPTSTDSGFMGTAKISDTGAPMLYDRQFWQDACGFTVLEAWEALNQEHNMGYESEAILKWFGLDEVRAQDPWDEACAGMGPGTPTGGGGTANAGGTGGMSAAGGTPGVGAGGMPGPSAGGATGGMNPVGPTAAPTPTGPTAAGPMPTGVGPTGTGVGPTASAGPVGTGVTPSGSAPVATGPAATTPGVPATGPAVPSGTASGAPPTTDSGGDDGGCSFGSSSTSGGSISLGLLALGFAARRRRAKG